MAFKINDSITLAMKWKIFKEFLVRENALANFIRSYGIGSSYGYKTRPPLTEYLKKVDLRSSGSVSRWLFNSMSWCDTTEGYEFWYKLDHKLYDYCQQFDLRTGFNLEKYRKTRPYGVK